MEYLLQENLPKVLPFWHGLSVQDIAQIKNHKRFFQDKLPDFGGTGVDISMKENDLKCYVGTDDEITFCAHICSLPFFPPKKVSLKSDPCLMSVTASNVRLKNFCVALDHLRRCANKTDGKFQNELLSSYAIAKKSNVKQSKRKFKKFSVPDTIIQLATEFPKNDRLSEANFDYLGGCLAFSQTTDGNPILLHPRGKKLNKLGITPLVEIYHPDKVFQPVYSERNTLKLKDDCIQKIKSAIPGYCFVQQGKFCHYINFTNPSSISTEQLFRKYGSFVNIAPSPYNPTEYISIDEDGTLELQDIDIQQTLWISKKVHPIESLTHNVTLKVCGFGSHPQSILSLKDSSIYGYDLRSNMKKESILFSKLNSSLPEEKFVNFKSLAVINYFQHLISSTSHLYVYDERYRKEPVLKWSHLLKSIPLYCDVACYSLKDRSSDAVALLGSQESCELSLYTIRSQESQIQPISLNIPLLLSSSNDFINSLKLHGIYVNDELEERIMNPLVGVCAIPHSKKMGFTAFQLSSIGDVFYQDFDTNSPDDTELTYRVDTGCTLTPPDRILSRTSKWTNFSFKSSRNAHSSRSNLVSVNVDLKDILDNFADISSGCDLCNNNTYSCDGEVVSTCDCSSCGLENTEVEKILYAFNNLELLAGPLTENPELDKFDVVSLSEFNDDYSKEILKSWINSEDVSSVSPSWNLDSDSHLSLDSSKSWASHSTIARNQNDSLNATLCSDIVTSQPSPHNSLFEDETMSGLPFPSQDSFEDFVPPSQHIRQLVGETIRTPIKSQVKLNASFAGF